MTVEGYRKGAWDFLKIDGKRLPGRVSKFDVAPERDVQTVRTPGYDGPDVKDQGYKGSPVAIEIECWREAQALTLLGMLSDISPQQLGGDTNPHAIEHPLAQAANISKIYIRKYSMGMPQGGLWHLSIDAAQWFPKPKKTQQGKEVPPDGGPLFDPSVPPPDPKNNGAKFP